MFGYPCSGAACLSWGSYLIQQPLYLSIGLSGQKIFAIPIYNLMCEVESLCTLAFSSAPARVHLAAAKAV